MQRERERENKVDFIYCIIVQTFEARLSYIPADTFIIKLRLNSTISEPQSGKGNIVFVASTFSYRPKSVCKKLNYVMCFLNSYHQNFLHPYFLKQLHAFCIYFLHAQNA